MRQAFRTPVLVTLVSAVLAGCGASPFATVGTDGTSMGALGKVTKYALGAKLSGRKVVDDTGTLRTQAAVAPSADLRDGCTPVGNQGGIGSCTAWAIGHGLAEFIAKKNGHETTLSPGFFYYEERKEQGNADMSADTGATIEVGMKVLEQTGICPEADHPYLSLAESKDAAKVKTYLAEEPSAKAIQDAVGFKIAGSTNFIPSIKGKLKPVPVSSLTAVKRSLANGMPVVAGIIVFQSMMTEAVKQSGKVPMPDPSTGDKPVGGHAIMLVGYDDTQKQFIVRNSWGSGWGDRGYFYLPYDYARVGLMQDAWTATEQ